VAEKRVVAAIDRGLSRQFDLEAPVWGGPSMWFNRIAGPKTSRNRLHLDLRALTSMDEEVGRLVALGAQVRERVDAITRLYDPEGNEFCVEASPSEHNATL
jgi:Glyoxalase-like domain